MFWYEDEVRRLEIEQLKMAEKAKTLFYGSSSFRLWTSLYDDLSHLQPANLGFGGSTLAACVWFFERVMKSYNPERIIIYAGDNDLGDGRHPEEVFIFFQQLAVKIYNHFGYIPCYYLSLKPSFSRWHMADQFRYTNQLIKTEIDGYRENWHFIDVFTRMLDSDGNLKKEYFLEDGLHMNETGYLLWKEIIFTSISTQ